MTSTLDRPPPAPTAGANAAEPPDRSRRDEVAIAVFATWMLFGLYLDGWAHTAEKPETFFSPWHGVLYSGFVAALLWFGVDSLRRSRSGEAAGFVPTDRLTAAGLLLFVAGALGDGVWHEIFGIEVDLEALLSPTHLLLLIGGFLMVTGPVRAAAADPATDTSTLRRFLPTAVTLTLATALVSFFTMYLSAFQGVGTYWVAGGDDVRELTEVAGLGAVAFTNLLLLVPVLYALTRWRTPPGTFTLLFTTVALSMTGLDAFERIELVLPALLGGIAADLLVRAGRPLRAVTTVTPLVLWTVYFVVRAAGGDLEWAPELVAGSVVLAVVAGGLLPTVLGAPRYLLGSPVHREATGSAVVVAGGPDGEGVLALPDGHAPGGDLGGVER